MPAPRLPGPFLLWFVVAVLAVPLVPFAVIGELPGVAWAADPDPAVVFALGVLLLAGDVFLPVPSSVLAVFLGARLGLVAGAAAVALGLTLGCAVGYAAGRWGGWPLVERHAGPRERAALQASEERWGLLALAAVRAVPVLSEASVLTAGAARWHPGRTLAVLALANAALGVVYALFGATGQADDAPGLLFAGSVVVPAVAGGAVWLAARRGRRSGVGGGG